MSTIPAEGIYGEIELDLIDLEPPGLFPPGQDSYWGQVRKVFADYLQTQVLDKLAQWYINLDPTTVNLDDINEWEYLVGTPENVGGLTLEQRRSFVLARLYYGPFTRQARQTIVESFITATFGPATVFSVGGIPITGAGITLFSGATSLAGSYSIVEDIENFSYQVVLATGISVDIVGITRELKRITPAGINFSVIQGTPAPVPPGRNYGDLTYGSNTYGG